MSAELQTALVNEVLDLSHMFKQNCALKHGLPEVNNNRVTKIDPPAKAEPIKVDITNNIPAAPAAPNSPSPGATVAADTDQRSLVKTVAPWLLSAAIGSGVAAPAYWWLFGNNEQPPTTETPQPKDGSLLQYLEDQGMHLPEGTWKAP